MVAPRRTWGSSLGGTASVEVEAASGGTGGGSWAKVGTVVRERLARRAKNVLGRLASARRLMDALFLVWRARGQKGWGRRAGERTGGKPDESPLGVKRVVPLG